MHAEGQRQEAQSCSCFREPAASSSRVCVWQAAARQQQLTCALQPRWQRLPASQQQARQATQSSSKGRDALNCTSSCASAGAAASASNAAAIRMSSILDTWAAECNLKLILHVGVTFSGGGGNAGVSCDKYASCTFEVQGVREPSLWPTSRHRLTSKHAASSVSQARPRAGLGRAGLRTQVA